MSHHVVAGDWSPFPDEPDQFTGDSLLERVARAYEKAIDAAGDAYDAEALAENAYLAAAAKAWAYATEDGVAITARQRHVDHQPEVVAIRQEWNRAVAQRKRCVLKAGELEHRMIAAQAHMRFIREGTGG